MPNNPFAQFDHAYDLVFRSPSARRRFRGACTDVEPLADRTLDEITKILRTLGHPDQDDVVRSLIRLTRTGCDAATVTLLHGITPALIASLAKRRALRRLDAADLGYSAITTIARFTDLTVDRPHMRLVSRIVADIARVPSPPSADLVRIDDLLEVVGADDCYRHADARLALAQLAPTAIKTIGVVQWRELHRRYVLDLPAVGRNDDHRSPSHVRADFHRTLCRLRRCWAAA